MIINIKSQDEIKPRGYSIQCRLTTEDPINGFAPDTGIITKYTSAGGYGIRLDGGNAFVNSEISPYYDSLLVKVTSWARSFDDATNKAKRALKEMKVQGVKTNRSFLMNVLNHPTFRAGKCDTGFIADNPELLNIAAREDKELKVLTFLGEKFVNGNRGAKPQFDVPVFPRIKQDSVDALSGTKQILDEKGPAGVVDWVKNQKKLLITDTTMQRRTAVADGYKSKNCRHGEDRSCSGYIRQGSVLTGNVGRSYIRHSIQIPQGITVGKTGYTES